MRNNSMARLMLGASCVVLLLGATTANAAPAAKSATSSSSSSSSSGGTSAADVAKAANNPLDPSTMHWQTQNNFNFKQGPKGYRRTGINTKIQPLIPVPLPHDWTFLMRPIFQINKDPRVGPTHYARKRYGVADFVPQFYFLTPTMAFKNGWHLTVGTGPSFTIPFNNGRLSSHRFAVGPNVAISTAKGPFRASIIAQITWSTNHLSSEKNKLRHPKTKDSSIQPNVSWTWDNGFFVETVPLISINWKAHSRKVTLPVGGGFGKAFTIAGQHLTADIHGYYNVKRQREAARWQFRAETTFLLKNPFGKLKELYKN